MRNKLNLTASRLQPGHLVTLRAQAKAGWAEPVKGNGGRPRQPNLTPPHPVILEELHTLLVNSLDQVPRLQGRVLVCVDCRPNLARGCWGLDSLPASQAAATTLLTLARGGAELDLVYCTKGKSVQQLGRNIEHLQ